MNKSIIILLGLSVLLLPFGSSMIAMGIASEDEYYNEQYDQRYENNDYEKSKNSDYIKKIKCNNNNINVNGENTGDINLGNDGQRAATEEGYLGASFIGSGYGNEGYNNKKGFDCVTNTNENIVQGGTGQSTQGPQGIQGPIGPTGPQGPSGITQFNDTNTYLVTNTTTNTFATNNIGQAICDPGDFVINGGFSITDIIDPPGLLVERLNRAILTPLASGWEVQINPTTLAGFVRYEVYAICFDNSPSMSLAATSTASQVQQQSEDSSIMSQEIRDEPIMTQAMENSPKLAALEKKPVDSAELTAMEKIDKLKTQWLNQLP